MKVVIIEDEPLIAQNLEFELLKADSNITVTTVLTSIQEALDYFENNPLPELFFSDIQLPDGLSFEIFKVLQCETPIIFCTAYDQYALAAFKANGIDYLLKPFSSDDINNTLNKFNKLKKTTFDFTQLNNFYQNSKSKSILVTKADEIIPINYESIIMVSIENTVTYLHTKNESKYVCNETLETIEEKLGNQFFKINRQTIIHRDIVLSAVNYFGRKLKIKHNSNFSQELVVSKAKVKSFLQWLSGGS